MSVDTIIDDSQALLQRSLELIRHEKSAAIWDNLAFHAATARLQMSGATVLTGPAAQGYIALVLAAHESAEAQRKLDDALETA